MTKIQDAIEYEIEIAAPPERIFQALTEPAQVPQWWGGRGAGQSYRCTHFERELRVGGRWKCLGLDGDGREFEVTGVYTELDPPLRLKSTWKASWTGDAETMVHWDLTATGNGTHVLLRHSGLAAHPEIAMAYRGWPQMLNWLRAYVEKGTRVDARTAP